jgi:hypothetical protein
LEWHPKELKTKTSVVVGQRIMDEDGWEISVIVMRWPRV